MYTDLIQNVALLLALSIFYSILIRIPGVSKNWNRILSGLLFGVMAIVGMMNPVHYAPGVIYDGRSIILSMAGLFGGGGASAVSIVIAGAYRAQIGGPGVWAGLATIIGSAMVGLGFRRAYGNNPEDLGILSLFGMGIAVHIVMLVCQSLVLPWPSGLIIIRHIWAPVMLLFPIAVVLMGFLLGSEKRRTRMERKLKENEMLLRLNKQVVDNSTDMLALIDKEFCYLMVSQSYANSVHLSSDEIIGKTVSHVLGEDIFNRIIKPNAQRCLNGEKAGFREWIELPDSGRRFWDVRYSPFRGDSGEISGFVVNSRDITDRKLVELQLRESEERYRMIFNHIPFGLIHHDTNGIISACNGSFVEIIGSSYEKLIGLNMLKLPDKRVVQAVRDALAGNISSFEGDYESVTADKITPVWGLFGPVFSYDGKVIGGVGIIEDISEKKKAEQEREQLQSQLVQSQKMESVGRLAGGVAHDYNNMLGVILGRAELLLAKMAADDPNRASVEAIMRAGQRSADLTRQLLAFARKQTIQPKVMNLNDEIEGMLKMLRRLIGENIDLVWQPSTTLWTVEMDPVQVDQILANLCVNARDAVSETGDITIETENIILDNDYCANRIGFVPGSYVMLAVSDDGRGMDEETRERIFEPFFTTKGVGKGTGLGLSTVYGIVKQNNGFINVYSEPGKGSTFRIYIPKHGEETAEKMKTTVEEIPRGNGQKILLVEDEVVLLEMTKVMLEELGYQVQVASLPAEAVAFMQENTCAIELLITDVVMPQMGGKKLADKITNLCNGVSVLFMSGYTANAIAHQGVLDKDVVFIQKPFSLSELAIKVKTALNKS